jgi:hypothetical protein
MTRFRNDGLVWAFAVGCLVAFLGIKSWSESLSLHLLATATVATLCGVVAGRFGDAAWQHKQQPRAPSRHLLRGPQGV